MVEISMENCAMLRPQPRSPLIWWGSIVFAGLVGAAAMNGYVTHQALNAAKASCHWTIQHELTRQKNILESQ